MTLSIIIPTYNRRDTLQECIERIFQQTLSPSRYELIIIDDGSNDGTPDFINSIHVKYPGKVRLFQQDHRGPAAARNRGILEAKGEIILFLGDDIFPEKQLFETHLEYHQKYQKVEDAVLGFIDWEPRISINSLMKYVNRGPQFAYPKIQNKDNAGYKYFYSSNISLKKKFLMDNGFFDESFRNAACEDTELGYRLEQKGLRIHYCPTAVGYHLHPITLDDFIRRAILVGRETHLLQQKHPGVFDRKDRKIERLFIQAILPFLLFFARITSHQSQAIDLVYRALFLYYFHLGYQRKV